MISKLLLRLATLPSIDWPSWLLSSDSTDEISLYCVGVLQQHMNSTMTDPTISSRTTMNNVELRNPMASNRNPLTEGPTNAPKANVDVHRPDTSPYVSMLSGRPWALLRNE